jgi:hypothetical protein
VSAHPRRVADDDTESAARRDVGKMRGETERKRGTVEDSAAKREAMPSSAIRLPYLARPGRLVGIAERVAPTSRDEYVAAFGRRRAARRRSPRRHMRARRARTGAEVACDVRRASVALAKPA